MKAVVVERTGDPSVLQYRQDWPEPTITNPSGIMNQTGPLSISKKDPQVLIRNEYIGVNYIDTYHRDGSYPLPLPFIPGR